MKKVYTLAQAIADPRVCNSSDERKGWNNDGIWLYLRYPWWCPATAIAVVHEYTVKDLCKSLNECIENFEWWENNE